MDMALGGDQGGSIRIPAAACGIVGLKPTYGLVPFTGIMPVEFTLDHTGPMARTVHDTALMLEVRKSAKSQTACMKRLANTGARPIPATPSI